ncbi:hypothetical protein A6P39_015045 [Streptomyces sp. FXJ1.172]|uniref:hypothetical protein n=1 Tax=Streptomyces sp. FXJ1.172 TaxID=710705 RepID=UPI000A4E7CBB|nr:hypothetical protein [Streptomyces sp. FXJ1.172]WEO95233.1 hypothetical protein A6P39_015045 [Streptomyces sp. FXJ1.172]
MPADEVTRETEVDGSRARTGPRHAAPRKPLFTRFHMPAGKAIASVAMPTAVLMGMGFTSTLALADSGGSPSPSTTSKSLTADEYKNCVKALDGSKGASASPSPSASASKSADSATPTPSASDSAKDTTSGGSGKTSSPDSGSGGKAAPTPTATSAPSGSGSGSGSSGSSGGTATPTPTPSASKSSGGLLDTIGNTLGGILTGGSSDSASPSASPTPSASASSAPASPSASSSSGSKVSDTVSNAGKAIGDTVKKTTDTVKKTTDSVSKTAQDTVKAAASAAPSPSASSSASTANCPAATTDQSGVDNKVPVADDPWYLDASSLLLKGADYQGIVEVKTASGTTKKVLKYVISDGTDIGDLHQTVKDKLSGKTYHVQAAGGSTSTIRGGATTMYTESISGNLFGLIPMKFTPDSPPPLNLPLIYFTNVKVVQAAQFGGNLHVPGMHVYTTDN